MVLNTGKGENMKRLLAIVAVVASAIMIIVFTAGCVGQKIAEKLTEETIERAIEKESGEDVEIDLDEGSMTVDTGEGQVNIDSDGESMEIQTDDGKAEFGTGADLPEDFPGDVPLYSDMEITTSWKSSEGDKTNYSITAVSEKGVDEIFGWYKDNLGGWEISGEFSLDTEEGKTSSFNAAKGEVEMTLMIMETEEGTTIVQSVTE
jgi:hypothetical protein